MQATIHHQSPAEIVAAVEERIAATTRRPAGQAESRWVYAELSALAAR